MIILASLSRSFSVEPDLADKKTIQYIYKFLPNDGSNYNLFNTIHYFYT